MSKEIAKKLIAELQENEELKAKIAGINDPAEMAKKAVEAGYDVTVEEMLAAEKEYRAELASKTDELSADELEAAAGGKWSDHEDAKDGHELNCLASYHDYGYQKDNNEWCKDRFYCAENNEGRYGRKKPHKR